MRTARAVMRWILAAFYVAAGIAHLWAPDQLLAITPSWVPFAPQVIFITGCCELAGAVALVTKPLRWLGRHRAGGLCDLRLAGQFQARDRWRRSAPHHQQLALSRTAAGVSAGAGLVGALCAEVIDWPWRRRMPEIRGGRRRHAAMISFGAVMSSSFPETALDRSCRQRPCGDLPKTLAARDRQGASGDRRPRAEISSRCRRSACSRHRVPTAASMPRRAAAIPALSMSPDRTSC